MSAADRIVQLEGDPKGAAILAQPKPTMDAADGAGRREASAHGRSERVYVLSARLYGRPERRYARTARLHG